MGIRIKRIAPALGWLLAVAAVALCALWLRLAVAPVGDDRYVMRFVLAYVLLALALIGGVGAVRGWRMIRPLDAAFALALLAWVGWTLASGGWALLSATRPAIAESAAITAALAASFALSIRLASPAAIRRALTLMILPVAAITIAQALNGGSIGLSALGEFVFSASGSSISVLIADGAVYVRPYGLMPHPNLNAGVLVVGILAALGSLLADRGAWRALGMVSALLGGTALLLTFSRGAFVGLTVGGLLLTPALWRAARTRDGRRALLLLIGTAIAVVVVWAAAYTPFLIARGGGGAEAAEQRSLDERAILSASALRAIAGSPWIGVGAGNFPWWSARDLRAADIPVRGDAVHQMYLLLMAEVGVIGFALWAIALAIGFVRIGRALRRADADARTTQLALAAGAVALLTIGLVEHYPLTQLPTAALFWGAIGTAGRIAV